jgi:hypothetical protein
MIKRTKANTTHLHDLTCVTCGNPFQIVGAWFEVMDLIASTTGELECSRCDRQRSFRAKAQEESRTRNARREPRPCEVFPPNASPARGFQRMHGPRSAKL